MKKLYQVYSNSLKAIVTGKYTSYELFPGFAAAASAAILQATDHRANTTSVCLPYDDEFSLEEILVKIIERIDDDSIMGDEWIKFDPSITEEKLESISEKWSQKFINIWGNWDKDSLSQIPEVKKWREKLNSLSVEALCMLVRLIITINPTNMEDILNLIIPPISLVENPPVIIDVPEQPESVQEQIQEQVVPEVNNEVIEEQPESVPQPSEEVVAIEEPVATTNSLGIPNENSNLRVPIEPVSLVDPSLSMTLGEGESLDPIPEMRFKDMSPEANAFYTIRGRKHYSNKRQAPLVFLLETSMEHLKKLGITHCIVSNIKFDTTGQLIDLVVSDQSTHKKFYVYFDTAGRHVDICTSKK